MLLSDIIADLSVRQVLGPTDRQIARVVQDSRAAGAQDVFVAIRGEVHDGRVFVPGLRVAAVIADKEVRALPGVTVVQVDDARVALAHAAAAAEGHPARQVPVVGITGTNGKTTTAWLVESVARTHGVPAAVLGTTGHRIAGRPVAATHTTPEAPVIQDLLAQARDADCGVVAMETSSIGLAWHRVDAIPFAVAVFTSFSRDHLDFHGTMDAYLAAKRRLFQELLSPAGTAVINGAEPACASLQPRGARTWTYGRSAGTDTNIAATEVRAGLHGTTARVATPAGEGDLRVNLLGLHNLDNALAALGATLALGWPLATCLDGIAALRGVPGRLEVVPNDRGVTVVVDYAHTPDALEHALSTLRAISSGRVLTVFGCGGDRDRGKRPQMGRIVSGASDLCLVTSDNPRSEDPRAIIDEIVRGVAGPHEVLTDRAEAIHRAVALAREGDVVLIAGKGHETTQTIGEVVVHFDDREVAAHALGGRKP